MTVDQAELGWSQFIGRTGIMMIHEHENRDTKSLLHEGLPILGESFRAFGNVSERFGDHSVVYVIPTYDFRLEISFEIKKKRCQ